MTDATNEQPESFDLNSDDIAARKRAELKRLFPEVFNEDKIDLDQLRRVMGDWVDEGTERFGLTWPGKAACMKVIQAPATGALRPDRDESVNFDESENVFIEGDNLEVLKLLQKAYFGKIKMIYIDPPYNTGKEFIYPDKYSESLGTYLSFSGQTDSEGIRFSTNLETSGRFHSNWLNMMYSRLYVARGLLREDGVIFISIDDNELFNLFHICCNIFGEENFIGNIAVVSNLKGRSDDEFFATAHNSLLCFAMPEFEPIGIKVPDGLADDYKEEDADGRRFRVQGLRKRGAGAKRSDRPNMYYEFYVDPETGDVSLEKSNRFSEMVVPKLSSGEDGRWRWGKSTASERLVELCGRTVGPEQRWDIFQIDYLEGSDGVKRVKPKTFWNDSCYSNERGSLQIKDIFGARVFDTPKPIELIQTLVEYSSASDGDIILDFFAGSASTGAAVAKQNEEDGISRRFILVQLPEEVADDTEAKAAGYDNICQIARDRLRKQTGLKGPIHFRSFWLSSSNFNRWDASSDEGVEDLITKIKAHARNVEDGEEAGILFELLLKDGFELTTKVDEASFAGGKVYTVADGAMLICLERSLTKEAIDGLADLAEKKDAARVVCLDAGFQGNDQLKTNAVQTFKSRLGHGEDTSIFRTV